MATPKTFFMDGVCLSEAGLNLIRKQSLRLGEKKRNPGRSDLLLFLFFNSFFTSFFTFFFTSFFSPLHHFSILFFHLPSFLPFYHQSCRYSSLTINLNFIFHPPPSIKTIITIPPIPSPQLETQPSHPPGPPHAPGQHVF